MYRLLMGGFNRRCCAVFLSLLAVVAANQITRAAGQPSCPDTSARTKSALRLIKSARKITRKSAHLADKIADAQPDARDTAAQPMTDQQYQKILQQYHDALQQYLKHRREVQQHVTQFHHDAQADKILSAPLAVSPYTKVKNLQPQDACMMLQAMEQQLIVYEMQLQKIVNFLINGQQTGQVGPQFSAQLIAGKELVENDQAAVIKFHESLVAKGETTRQQLHDQTHMAFLTGDYVESQQAFAAVERREALVAEELQRLQTHADLANAFQIKLELLGAPQKDEAQPAAVNPDNPDSLSFPAADQLLQQEYSRVQDLYRQLREARPRH